MEGHQVGVRSGHQLMRSGSVVGCLRGANSENSGVKLALVCPGQEEDGLAARSAQARLRREIPDEVVQWADSLLETRNGGADGRAVQEARM